MKWGWLIPQRKIIVLGETSATLYVFRFQKMIHCEKLSLPLSVTFQGEILFNALPQEIYRGSTPPLKLLDRKQFLKHFLKDHFKTTQWIATHWLTSRTYMAIKAEPPFSFEKDETKEEYGALCGELLRLKIFEHGEGLIFSPTSENKVHQIYIKDHCPTFIRLINHCCPDWEAEIETVKRYLERQYNVTVSPLPVLWWGSNPPNSSLMSYSSLSFEEKLVHEYVKYWCPALKYQPDISSSPYFTLKRMWVVRAIFQLGIIGLIIAYTCMMKIFFQNDKQIATLSYEIEHKRNDLKELQARLKEKANAPHSEWDIKSVINAYQKFSPLQETPLSLLRGIAAHLSETYVVHELFWGRGHATIFPKDLTITFHPFHFDSSTVEENLIIEISSPMIQNLYELEKNFKKSFSSSHVNFWEAQEINLSSQEPIIGVFQLQSTLHDLKKS